MPYLQSLAGYIYYEVAGQKSSPLIVFTHGAGMDHKMFKNQIPAFADKYRILVWDMPGHGNSASLRDKFKFSSVADKLIMLLNQINADKAILVGQSLGGYISQYTAYHFPEYVEALAVIGCTPLHQKSSSQDKLFLNMTSKIFNFGSNEDPLFKENLWGYFAHQIALNPSVKKYAQESLLRVGKRQLSVVFDGLKQGTDIGIDRPPEKPLLITHGNHEIIGNVWRDAPGWYVSVKNSKYVVIPYAGHNANQDNPEYFNAVLLSFLESIGY